MSRGTRPIQYRDANGTTIPYNPSDNTSRVVYASDLYRFYGSVRPGTAVTVAGWRISKETLDTSGNTLRIEYYNGLNDFTNIWDSGTTLAITGATKASPCVLTMASTATLTTNDIIYITGVVGMTELNGKHFLITVLNTTTISLQDMDNDENVSSIAYTTWSSGGTLNKVNYANATNWA